jgi:hypothetical protein
MTCKDVGPSSIPLPDGDVRELEDVERHPRTSIYIGETSFSVYHRGLNHVESMTRPQAHKDNAFAKHNLEYHQERDTSMEVKVDVVKNFTRPMQRQVWEGVEIREVSCDILLNSKQDHYAPVVGRMEERREAIQRARV